MSEENEDKNICPECGFPVDADRADIIENEVVGEHSVDDPDVEWCSECGHRKDGRTILDPEIYNKYRKDESPEKPCVGTILKESREMELEEFEQTPGNDETCEGEVRKYDVHEELSLLRMMHINAVIKMDGLTLRSRLYEGAIQFFTLPDLDADYVHFSISQFDDDNNTKLEVSIDLEEEDVDALIDILTTMKKGLVKRNEVDEDE